MTPWQELTKLALLGTERQKEPLRADGVLGAVLARIAAPPASPATATRELALLDATAVVSTYQRAGHVPPVVTRALPDTCPPEDAAALGAQAAFHLSVMLSDKSKRPVLREWLMAVGPTGKRVPFSLLPAVLDVGRHDRTMRPLILPVIGHRGRWLARHNPQWRYAVGSPRLLTEDNPEETTRVWETAHAEARLVLLQRLRQSDPAHARTLVESTWRTERAPQRALFLDAFQHGISRADEPFLESCLEDKSKEVRQAAVRMLSRIAESRLCARMQDRVAPLLSYDVSRGAAEHPAKKLTGKGTPLAVTLPTTFDPAWERDGILEQPPPGKGKGKKAWWVEQMLGMVPPSVWTRRWSVTPDDVLASALKSEWKELLLSAWTAATTYHADPTWAEALLAVHPDVHADLWMHLPRPRREAVFTKRLAGLTHSSARFELLLQLPRFTDPWSESFSVAIAKAILSLSQEWVTLAGYHTHRLLQTCAIAMSPRTAETIEQLWITTAENDSSWSRAVAEPLDTLRFRAACLHALT